MQFEIFQTRVQEAISRIMGEEASVQIKEVMKNNGILLHGLVVLEKGSNVAPTIYLEPFYEKYLKGEELGNIVLEIIQFCKKENPIKELDMKFFTNYEIVKKRIMMKLINKEKNKELLEQIPHIPFLNLAIVFYYAVMNEYFGNGSILIYWEHMKKWQVDVDTLYQAAYENTKQKLGCQIMDMKAVVGEIVQEQIEEELREKMEKNPCAQNLSEDMEVLLKEVEEALLESASDSMFVLTNKMKYQGAICMVYPEYLQIPAQKLERNLFILPCSVHEVILLPDTGKEDVGKLCEMVQEVNRTQLEQEEILADNVYYYDRETQKTSLLLP